MEGDPVMGAGMVQFTAVLQPYTAIERYVHTTDCCTMDEWSTHEFGEWEGKIADRTKARRSEIVRWSER